LISIILLLTPFLVGLAGCIISSRYTKTVALLLTVGQLILSFVLGMQLSGSLPAFAIRWPFIPALGSSFYLGIDALSVVMLLLNGIVFSLIFLYLHSPRNMGGGLFSGLLLLLQAALNGVYLIFDLLWFYIFWELALIPVFILLIKFTAQASLKTFLKFFIYTIAGSIVMLAGIIYLGGLSREGSLSAMDLYKNVLPLHAQTGIFLAFFAAFAVKIPLFPFHSWQPETYTQAPSVGTMALSGAMLKMALFGLLRWVLPICPAAIAAWPGHLAILLAVVGVIYASLIAISESNIKKMFAYASMAHVGIMAAAILSMQAAGLHGAMLFMVAHGVNAVGLFLLFDILYTRVGHFDGLSYGGIRHQLPVFSGLYLLIILASIGLPLTNGFFGEFLSLSSIFAHTPVLGALAGVSVILGAVYMLRSYQSVFLGAGSASLEELNFIEKLSLWIIAGLIIFMGLFPEILLQFIRPAADLLIKSLNL